MKRLLLVSTGMLIAFAASAGQGRYMDQAHFLDTAFKNTPPDAAVLWVTPELRESIKHVLGHRFTMLRVRYWEDGETTAWIFDEIGKEAPITIGVGVDAHRVAMVRVLEFRESRGWEVRYPFFTDQFSGAGLVEDGAIDQRIDGITGATLSVAAVSRVVQLALLLDGHVYKTAEDVAERSY